MQRKEGNAKPVNQTLKVLNMSQGKSVLYLFSTRAISLMVKFLKQEFHFRSLTSKTYRNKKYTIHRQDIYKVVLICTVNHSQSWGNTQTSLTDTE